MYCPKCKKFTLPHKHVSASAKLNKLCCECLENPQVEPLYIEDNLESIINHDLFPIAYILIPREALQDYTLQEFGNEFVELIYEKYKLKFR
jgi:hypothetical protein